VLAFPLYRHPLLALIFGGIFCLRKRKAKEFRTWASEVLAQKPQQQPVVGEAVALPAMDERQQRRIDHLQRRVIALQTKVIKAQRMALEAHARVGRNVIVQGVDLQSYLDK
jgi:hypothetical protein